MPDNMDNEIEVGGAEEQVDPAAEWDVPSLPLERLELDIQPADPAKGGDVDYGSLAREFGGIAEDEPVSDAAGVEDYELGLSGALLGEEFAPVELPKDEPKPEPTPGPGPKVTASYIEANYGSLAQEFAIDLRPQIRADDVSTRAVDIAWIGSGQCGGRLVKGFADLGYAKALAVNTTDNDLDGLELADDKKFLMDIGSRGAGKDISRGAEAVRRRYKKILKRAGKIFGSDTEHVMVCFGSGGGTGSGSATGLIDLAMEYASGIGLKNVKRRVGVVMTLPTKAELKSPRVAQNTYQVASAIFAMATKGQISPLVIVDNARIDSVYPDLTMRSFFSTANRDVCEGFDIFNRLASVTSNYTSFDPQEYRSILSAGGCIVTGSAEVGDVDGDECIAEAMKPSLERTLWADGFDLSTTKVAGGIIVAGAGVMNDEAGLQTKVEIAFGQLADLTSGATIHRGIYEDQEKNLRVYSIFGGLRPPIGHLNKLK